MSDNKKIFWIVFWVIFVVVFVAIATFIPYYIFNSVKTGNVPTIPDNKIISEITNKDSNDVNGILFGHTVWEGNITVTGDVIVAPSSTLEIKPGTIIRFTSNKDSNPSKYDIEVEADGFNDEDPSRLKSYADSHIAVFVAGSLIAKGTKENPIIFTSDAKDKHYADWAGLNLVNGDSTIEHAIVEYSRHGISVSVPNENIIVRETLVSHTLWGCFSIKNSKGLYENNFANDCGHEGFDVGNDARIFNNKVTDSHSALVLLGGSPVIINNTFQSDVHEFPGATPILENNVVNYSLGCKLDKTWDYMNYRIPCQGDPYLVE